MLKVTLSTLSLAAVLSVAARHPDTAGLLVPLALASVCAVIVSALTMRSNGSR